MHQRTFRLVLLLVLWLRQSFLNIFVSYFVAIFFFKDFINNHLAKRLLASALFFNLVIKSSTVIVEPFIVAISFEPLEHAAKLKRPLRPLQLRLVFSSFSYALLFFSFISVITIPYLILKKKESQA